MEELLKFSNKFSHYDFPIIMFLLKSSIILFIVIAIILFIYDKFIQRENQLLINYPLVGRLRYLFYALRDPMRQYFGDENFYDSFDKVKWVNNAAEQKPSYTSFSPSQPINKSKLTLKNVNCVLNSKDVSKEFHVTFGENTQTPFTTNSVIGRSAMSDGAISPEGTRAFSKGAFLGSFPINTGEGSLTSNFLYTHKYNESNKKYLEIKEGTFFAKSIYKIIKFLLNKSIAQNMYKHMIIYTKDYETYLFDENTLICYRINWDTPLENFPTIVPKDIPDIIFQMGSGLYGVRKKDGTFCEERYKKIMSFSKMTEIKMAQGAKQTGGKLLANKVTEAIAYYRGVPVHQNLFSPNQFPYAKTLEELFDFIGKLKKLSKKPVGVKIVISSKESFEEYATLIKERIKKNSLAYPDFITIDGTDGGSGAAPLEMMMSVGMSITKALYIADTTLHKLGVRDKVKLIASVKVLTPDDATALLALGADFVSIARAFMMSAGCIRARECSGANGRDCPVGLATQNKKKRASFLVEKKAVNIASYHNQLIEGIHQLLAIMGVTNIKELNKTNLIFRDNKGKNYMNIDKYFQDNLQD